MPNELSKNPFGAFQPPRPQCIRTWEFGARSVHAMEFCHLCFLFSRLAVTTNAPQTGAKLCSVRYPRPGTGSCAAARSSSMLASARAHDNGNGSATTPYRDLREHLRFKIRTPPVELEVTPESRRPSDERQVRYEVVKKTGYLPCR
ncbi:hypothetical protein WAI453_001970 [Rhynchosporium graminicola]